LNPAKGLERYAASNLVICTFAWNGRCTQGNGTNSEADQEIPLTFFFKNSVLSGVGVKLDSNFHFTKELMVL